MGHITHINHHITCFYKKSKKRTNCLRGSAEACASAGAYTCIAPSLSSFRSRPSRPRSGPSHAQRAQRAQRADVARQRDPNVAPRATASIGSRSGVAGARGHVRCPPCMIESHEINQILFLFTQYHLVPSVGAFGWGAGPAFAPRCRAYDALAVVAVFWVCSAFCSLPNLKCSGA